MISLLGRIFSHFNLIGSYYLAHFPSFGEDLKGKKWSCLVLKCYIFCQQQWVFTLASSALQTMGYFYLPWHFQTETTQGWRYSDWELSLGCSVGPLPPRAACLSQESCCWCQFRHGSNGPGTSLPARNPGRKFRMWGTHRPLDSPVSHTQDHSISVSIWGRPRSLQTPSHTKMTSKGDYLAINPLMFGGWWIMYSLLLLFPLYVVIIVLTLKRECAESSCHRAVLRKGLVLFCLPCLRLSYTGWMKLQVVISLRLCHCKNQELPY